MEERIATQLLEAVSCVAPARVSDTVRGWLARLNLSSLPPAIEASLMAEALAMATIVAVFTPTAGRGHMLPHAAEQDQLEGEPLPMDRRQRWKPVLDPGDPRTGMPGFGFGPHGGGGLNGDDAVSLPGEPGRVPPAAGTDVEHQGRRRWEQILEPSMEPRRIDRLLCRRGFAGMGVVPGRGHSQCAHAGRTYTTPPRTAGKLPDEPPSSG